MSDPLTIVIVGGVAGGASAAARARRMNEDARIIIFEKDDHVSFANCGLPYYIGGEIEDREKLLVATPEFLEKRFNIEVRIRHEVRGIHRDDKTVSVLDRDGDRSFEQAYDKLILAPGAAPIVPPLDGVESNNVFTLRNVADTDAIHGFIAERKPTRAVVIGAGYIGLEMVEQLRERGMDVALVELQDQVMPLLDPEMAHIVETEIRDHDVSVHLGRKAESFVTEGDHTTAVTLDSGEQLEGDLFILGIGVRPMTRLAEDADLTIGETRGILVDEYSRTSDPDIYAVGDAVEYEYGPTGKRMRVALAGPANRAGRLAGEHAATGRSDAMAPVWGTSVVRVFGLTAALTGLSVKHAERLEMPHHGVAIRAAHHVGYYPGAETMTLKLVFDPSDGKILGAEIVGGEGVDKRIDVIATAMHFGGTVRDLTRVDLAYAPPFGAAKDPVHMAGFAACNHLDGVVEHLPTDIDVSDYQMLDVRTDAEVEKLPLRYASNTVHIPVDELRDRLNELDRDKPTLVTCASGVRSYLACRMLQQHGFSNVANLVGGALLRSHVQSTRPRETAAAK